MGYFIYFSIYLFGKNNIIKYMQEKTFKKKHLFQVCDYMYIFIVVVMDRVSKTWVSEVVWINWASPLGFVKDKIVNFFWKFTATPYHF